MSGDIKVPIPVNEPVLAYTSGTSEKEELKEKLRTMSSEEIEIPLIIGGEEVRTGETNNAVMPHRHAHLLARGQRA